MRALGSTAGRLAAASVALCLAVAPPASAGRRDTANVTIDAANRTASGSLGSARAGSGLQEIGCAGFLIPSATGSQRMLWCYAIASNGAGASCAMAYSYMGPGEPLQGFKEDSFLRFSWDASGLCTRVDVENYSYYAPVVP